MQKGGCFLERLKNREAEKSELLPKNREFHRERELGD